MGMSTLGVPVNAIITILEALQYMGLCVKTDFCDASISFQLGVHQVTL